MSSIENNASSKEEQLPFDIRTLFIGIWLRKYILAGSILLSLILGTIAGYKFGTRVYSAETVLVYQPILESNTEDASQSLNTLLHLVKIQSNLEATRDRLNLPVSTQSLGAAVDVFIKQNTDILVIRAQRSSPGEAADIANTLRDVFIENQKKMRSGQWYLEELASVDKQYQETLLQKEGLDEQEANVDRIINELKERINTEEAASKEFEGLGNLNIRVSRLRDAIEDDKNYRANLAELAKKETELNRAEKLWERNIISQAEYDNTRADYERQKALTEDTDQTRKWKDDLEEINKTIIPADSKSAPSAPLLREMMLKIFEIQLERVSVTEKLRILEEKRAQLTELLRQFQTAEQDTSKSYVIPLTTDKIDWAEMTADERLAILSQSSGFNLVSNATAPVFPQQSNRKLIFIAIVFMGSFLGVTVVLGLELMDTTIKSEADLKLKFDIPVFGVVPKLSSNKKLLPGPDDSDAIEYFRLAARKMRSEIQAKGARILILSPGHKDGSTFTAANLAACLGRLDERVLIIDAQIRSEDEENPLYNLLENESGAVKGLGEFLSYESDDINDIIHTTNIPGVMCIPRVGKAVIPDLLGSIRMKELLEGLSKSYSIILIDSPPLFPYVDAELLAKFVDAVLMVVVSKKTKAGTVKKSLERLSSSNKNKIGFILNRVSKYYMEKI